MATTLLKLLLTGSTGFVGSAILQKLKHEPSLKIHTLARRPSASELQGSHVFHHEYDLSDFGLQEVMKKEQFEILIHCAWEGLPEKKEELSSRNKELTINLFSDFLTNGGSFFMGMGSCLEYGSESGCIDEHFRPLRETAFAESKTAILQKVSDSKIDFAWLRPFYLYGEGQHSNSLIRETIKNLNNTSSSWLGRPNLTNDFVYVEDLANIVSKIILGRVSCGALNIGTSVSTKNIEFVNRIRNLLGFRIYSDSESEISGIQAGLSKFRSIFLDFDFTPLDIGLTRTLGSMSKLKNK